MGYYYIWWYIYISTHLCVYVCTCAYITLFVIDFWEESQVPYALRTSTKYFYNHSCTLESRTGWGFRKSEQHPWTIWSSCQQEKGTQSKGISPLLGPSILLSNTGNSMWVFCLFCFKISTTEGTVKKNIYIYHIVINTCSQNVWHQNSIHFSASGKPNMHLLQLLIQTN